MKKLIDLYDKYKSWRLYIQIRKSLIKKYEHSLMMEYLLEQWVIKRIRDGQTDRRKELAEKQAAIKETKSFINYLKTL